MSFQAEKRCELCGAYLASDDLDSRFCSPCCEKLRDCGLTDVSSLPKFYGVEGYADEHLMSPEQVRRRCRLGQTLAVKIGRRWLIPRGDVAPLLGQPEVKEGLEALLDIASLFEDKLPVREVAAGAKALRQNLEKRLPFSVVAAKVESLIESLPPPDQVLRKLLGR